MKINRLMQNIMEKLILDTISSKNTLSYQCNLNPKYILIK